MYNKKEKDFESYMQLRNDYILVANIILDTNLNLKYKDPYHNCHALDHAIFTEEIQIIDKVLQKYEEEGISFKNVDLLSSLIIFNLADGEANSDREYIKIIEMLLDKNIEINMLDYDTGEPPIYLAAKYRSKEMVQLLCKYNDQKEGSLIDFDYFTDRNGKCARNLIIKYKLYDGSLPTTKQCLYHSLYKHLKDKNASEFIKQYREDERNMTDDKKCSFLFRAVQLGSEEIVEYMLEETEDIFDDYETLLRMACGKGYHRVVETLLREKEINFDINLIKILTLTNITEERNKGISFSKCLELLLDAKKMNLNEKDKSETTVLQYAVKYKHFKRALILLKYGASLNTSKLIVVFIFFFFHVVLSNQSH